MDTPRWPTDPDEQLEARAVEVAPDSGLDRPPVQVHCLFRESSLASRGIELYDLEARPIPPLWRWAVRALERDSETFPVWRFDLPGGEDRDQLVVRPFYVVDPARVFGADFAPLSQFAVTVITADGRLHGYVHEDDRVLVLSNPDRLGDRIGRRVVELLHRLAEVPDA